MTIPCLCYVICATERTGSSLLADALGGTGLVRYPFEALHPHRMSQQLDGKFLHEIASAQRDARFTVPYGAKVHWSHLEDLATRASDVSGGIDFAPGTLLDEIFPGARHVWLSRRNKLRQAISLVRARLSGVWWQPEDERVERATLQDPTKAAVEEAVRVLKVQDDAWRRYFDQRNLKPLHMYYEDIVDAYDHSVRDVLHYLGTPLAPTQVVPRPRLRRQADEWSERMLRRIITRPTSYGNEP